MAAQLAPYLSEEELSVEVAALAMRLDAEVREYGKSVEGRALRAVRIGSGKRRNVLVCANIHGPEFIGTCVALGLLQRLADGDMTIRRLAQRANIWVIPSVNPDGYARTWSCDGLGELNELRPNARGVDLNRNFPKPGPLPWYAASLGGWATGSSDPDNPFYRGSAPLSEPETRHLADLFARVPFHASANLHSTMGTLFLPHVPDRKQRAVYRRLGRAFVSAQPTTRYIPIKSAVDWFTGEQEDYQHHECGTWAICVEHYPAWIDVLARRRERLFWQFNPRSPRRWIDNDVPGIVAFFHAALDAPPPTGANDEQEMGR